MSDVQDTPSSTETPTLDAAATVDAVLASKNESTAGEKKEATKVESVKEEPKKADPLAAKFAALTKQNKAIREREKALEAREKAWKAKEEGVNKPAPEPEKAPLKSRMKKDPFNTLKEEFGLDLDILTKIALNQGKLPADMEMQIKQEESEGSLRAELDALKKQLADKDESEKTSKQQEAEQKALQQFKGEIGDHIKAAPAEYELLGLEEDPSQVVFDVINAHYDRTRGFDPEKPDVGRILSIKEAADHVETHLLDEAKKYAGLSKIKGLFGAQTPKGEVQAPKEAGPKTLSNEQNGEAPPANKRVQSREEELAEAMKLIKYTSN